MDRLEKLNRLRALEGLADLVWQADAARFGALAHRDAAAKEAIDALRRERSAWMACPEMGIATQAERLWQARADQKIRALNVERARLRSEMERLRPRLAGSYGRKTVLQRLGDDADQVS